MSSAKAILKAASLIKKFQSENQLDEFEIDLDELLRKKEGNSEMNSENRNIDENYLTESELKVRDRNKKKQELFNTDIFKKVFNQIVGHKNPVQR